MVYYKRFDALSRDCVYIIKYNSVDESSELRSCVNVEVAVEVAVPNKLHGFCGRKATLNQLNC